MTRLQLFGLAVICIVFMPFLALFLVAQALFGSKNRAKNMEIAEGEEGNSLFGGPPIQTISARTGNALIQGKRWAQIIGPMIDHLMGKGHCLSNATIPVPAGFVVPY